VFGTIWSQLGLLALVGACAFALWKGGAAERLGGALNLFAGLLVMLLDSLLQPDVKPLARLAVDGVLAAGFLVLALRYSSLWLGAAMLLQAVQFSLLAYYLVSELRHDNTFVLINNLDTTGINLCIVTGTALTWRRRVIAATEA